MSAAQAQEIVQAIGALRRQLCLYELIYQLTRRQKAAIEGNDADTLSGILSEKQKYLEEIGGLHQRLVAFRSTWERVKDEAGEDARGELRAVSEQIAERLQQTVALEKENIALATLRRDDVAFRLKTVRQHRGAVKHYGAGSGAQPPVNLMDTTL